MSRFKEILEKIGLVLAVTGLGSGLVGACISKGFGWVVGIGSVLLLSGLIALAASMLVGAIMSGVSWASWIGRSCSALWAYETVPTRPTARFDLSPSPANEAGSGLPGDGYPAGLPPALLRNQEIRLFVRKYSGNWDEGTWSPFLARVQREYGPVNPSALRAACEGERTRYQESQGDELRAIDRLLAQASAYGPPKPFRNKYLGWLLKGAGNVLFVAGALAIGIAFWLPLKDRLVREEALGFFVIFGLVLGLPLLLLGSVLRNLGSRLASRDAAAEFYADDRLPVVYLRSFQEDTSIVGAALWMTLSMMPHILSRGRFASDPDRIGMTSEERLADEFRQYGPVIAIGRPGDRLAPTGAARAYVGHEEWQAFVIDLITRASLVIVRLGRSDGLSWEIETALKGVPWTKLLFQLPEGGLFGWKKRAAYESFRQRSSGLIGSVLPADCRGFTGLIQFDASGNPLIKVRDRESGGEKVFCFRP